MIVVVGRPAAPEIRAVASAIAGRGGRCELVGTAAPGTAGDRLLGELAAIGIGHAAILRTPAADLDSADLGLALRYLPDSRVIVLVGQATLAPAAASAASWAGATLIVVTTAADSADLPDGDHVVALAAPARDPDGAFAGLVADLAIRLDGGDSLAAAWRATLGATGAETVGAVAIGDPRPDAAGEPGGSAVSDERASASGAAAGSEPVAAPGPARRASGRRCGRR